MDNYRDNLPDKEEELQEERPADVASHIEGDDIVPSLNFDALTSAGTLDACSTSKLQRGTKLEWLEEEVLDEVVEADTHQKGFYVPYGTHYTPTLNVP